MKKSNCKEIGIVKQRRTARLETVSKLYDIPLNSLRKRVSQNKIPGILRRPGARRIYIDLERFDRFWRQRDVEGAGQGA